jgi:hypothetical protein
LSKTFHSGGALPELNSAAPRRASDPTAALQGVEFV